jgi:hypothetical protein
MRLAKAHRTTEPTIRISRHDGGNARQDAAIQESGSSPEVSSTHAAVYNTLNVQRHLTSAQTPRALRRWDLADRSRSGLTIPRRRYFALAARQCDKASPTIGRRVQ